MTTDIVVCTCDRLGLLRQTVNYIVRRTRSPFRLYLIDDASGGKTVDYVEILRQKGIIRGVLRRKNRAGISANLRALLSITESDPIVFTDDDVLCPDVEPDWLARGLAAMRRFPSLGLLALNNPACNIRGNRGKVESADPVSFCRNVGATFLLARRAVLVSCHPQDGDGSPVKRLCYMATDCGWRIGYLTNVYCRHTGKISMRTGKDLSRGLALVSPINTHTLEPPDAYKG